MSPETETTGSVVSGAGPNIQRPAGTSDVNGNGSGSDELPSFVFAVNALGVPLFVGRPSGDGSEFIRPNRWQQVTADGNAERLALWRPGWAVAALCGVRFIVIDVDPRNGGNTDEIRASLFAAGVRIYAEVSTPGPGDGRHFYVAHHPDITPVTSLTGVDILATTGRNVFLPGTQRPKYQGRGYSVVMDNLDAL